jgi:UDP-galactose transporter B1
VESRTQFAVCFIGIFVSYFIFGILQEAITKTKYGANEERFTFTYCLVFVQCIGSALVSKAILTYNSADKSQKMTDTTPKWMHAFCSLTYLGAMLASNEALQHISYPTQVLGKSVKPVPVMILGVLIARKRYHMMKYLGVLTIVVGIVLFMFKEQKQTPIDDPLPNHPYAILGFGECLLIFSLAMDGLTGAFQDKMNLGHKTNPHFMMFNMNLWSCLWLFLAVILTGECFEYIIFVQKYPIVLWYMALLGLCASVGQHFIFTTITSFGPLTCSIITTTRKFFTILGSVFLFSNPMSHRQWVGAILVFVGLAIDSQFGKEIKGHKKVNQKL